jgi:cobyrinic acid a,c-diamide synthase
MMGREYVRRLFTRASADADISVVEGVMGLFDGANSVNLEGSTAEIACWLDAPVILIAGAHGAARSFAAMVKGYATFEAEVKVAGAIANYCGSDRHAEMLAESLSSAGLPPLIGAISQGALPSLPSRHLGLVTADHRNLSDEILDTLADVIERRSSIEEIIRLAGDAPDLSDPCPLPQSARTGIRIGVAYDSAFHFYYQDLFDELESRGCEILKFSPINDMHLPDGLHAIYLGGGYPEENAEALSGNLSMLDDIRQFAASGRPIYAECGGLMYLARGIHRTDGGYYPLLEILPTETSMLKRRMSLGYVEATLARDSLWGTAGATLRGHEFHYSEMTSDPTQDGDWKSVYDLAHRRSDTITCEGFQCGNILASYAHLHLASHPEAIEWLIKRFSGSQAQ